MNNKVIELAIKMCEKSHAPFSNYKVGSSVETSTGEIVGGCNIESSSYGLTCCAERVAIFKAISEGYREFKSIAVATKNAGMPCGACRQVMVEYERNQQSDITIFLKGEVGEIYELKSIGDLLPLAFKTDALKRH